MTTPSEPTTPVSLHISNELLTLDIPDFAAFQKSPGIGTFAPQLAMYYASLETDEAKKQAVLSCIDPSIRGVMSGLATMITQTKEGKDLEAMAPKVSLPADLSQTILQLTDAMKNAFVTKDGQTTLDIFGIAKNLSQSISDNSDQSKE